jgi:hypothetical protein
MHQPDGRESLHDRRVEKKTIVNRSAYFAPLRARAGGDRQAEFARSQFPAARDRWARAQAQAVCRSSHISDDFGARSRKVPMR